MTTRTQCIQGTYIVILFLFILAEIYFAKASSETIGLETSLHFPHVSTVTEFITLSDMAYRMRSCQYKKMIPDVICHTFLRKKDGSKVMVVSSDQNKYVAIVFAGSENVENWIHDFHTAFVTFGPRGDPIANVKVHKGFNHAVFGDDLYSELSSSSLLLLDTTYTGYDFVVSGHSLGGADAILTGAAIAHQRPHLNVTVVNYGCPRTGGKKWKEWVNGMPNLGIWRIVYRDDIVPRVPNSHRYHHVGHTVQLKKRGAKAYYLHSGDKDLGFKGVPWNWESKALLSPTSALHHQTHYYKKYIYKKSTKNPETYFVNSFERINNFQLQNETRVKT